MIAFLSRNNNTFTVYRVIGSVVFPITLFFLCRSVMMSKADDLNRGITQCLRNIEWMEAQLSLLRVMKFTQAQPFLDQIGYNWARVREMLSELNSLGIRYKKDRTYYISKPDIISKVWNYPEMIQKSTTHGL